MQHTVAILGEAEKGKFKTPHFLKDLSGLIDCLGNPPPESCGLYFAIQAVLFQRALIYFRVEEEGFSEADYYSGFKILENSAKIQTLNALCLPGVGDPKILDASRAICRIHKSFLITTPKDLHDYLTSAL
jgi:hypothetical protein